MAGILGIRKKAFYAEQERAGGATVMCSIEVVSETVHESDAMLRLSIGGETVIVPERALRQVLDDATATRHFLIGFDRARELAGVVGGDE